MTAVLCEVFCPLFSVDFRQFAPFLLAGLAFWNFLVSTAAAGCHCFFQGESYIRQQAAPWPSTRFGPSWARPSTCWLPSSWSAVTWGIQGFGNLPALISLVPTLALMLISAGSLALCCGLANVIFQDTQHLVEVLFQILFYLTPVMYPAKVLAARQMEWLVKFNPLAAFLELLRAPILDGQFPTWTAYATALALVTMLMTLSAVMLVRLERRLIFYL